MKKKIIGIIATTALLFIIILSGCDLRPLSIGFGGRIGLVNPILGAVRSNRRVFNIDEVTLDFYFGGHILEYAEDDERQAYGVALYFCNSIAYNAIEIDVPYDDYKNLQGLHFIKLIETEEFNSEEYEVTLNLISTKFNHYEKFTVPKQVFTQEDDCFYLAFIDFYVIKNQPYFYRTNGGGGRLKISYEFKNEQQVKLS